MIKFLKPRALDPVKMIKFLVIIVMVGAVLSWPQFISYANAEKKDKDKDECVKPARGPIVPGAEASPPHKEPPPKEFMPPRASKMLVRVGKEAVDFEANAYVQGHGFKPVKLSDYKGKWIVLCFYPGDFTFV